MKIYQQSDLDYDLSRFKELLTQIKVKQPQPELNLLGDEIGDRGKNDILNFFIFKFLDDNRVKYSFEKSNHAFQFLMQFAFGLNTPDEALLFIFRKYEEKQEDYSDQGASYYGLRKDIQQGRISEEAVVSLIEKHYLPHFMMNQIVMKACVSTPMRPLT